MLLTELQREGTAPSWMVEESFNTISKGYLLPGETPREMYRRVANSAAKYLGKPELADKFYRYIDNNWLCPATPILSNAGTDRGLVISCYGLMPGDSVDSIFRSFHESAMLLKNGGGVGKYWGSLRERGSPIKGNGTTDGIIPWLKVEEATLQSTSQGGVRRGSGAQYLPVRSNEIEEFIDIRRSAGDLSRKCTYSSFHHAICIDDEFMEAVEQNKRKELSIWVRALKARADLGEPYFMWTDTANRLAPAAYKKHNLKIRTSQLCNEIYLTCDEEHTFVCCLSSLNLLRWDEWKDTDLVETSIQFLDGIMSEFIAKADGIPGFDNAIRFARKSRALGLGVLGWHSLLQSKMIPFDSFEAMRLNAEIFKTIHDRAWTASRQLAEEFGEVEWTAGCGVRNTNVMAVAPTFSNALISGGVSQGIEPIIANSYAHKTAKGTFNRKNPLLRDLLRTKGKDTFEVWNQITVDGGSVRNLDFLSDHEKAVFATAKEINQFTVVRQAAQRQTFIDQGQSLNLFFPAPASLDTEDRVKLGNYMDEVHREAWRLGLKGLYYARQTNIARGDAVYRSADECKSCEG